MTPGDAIMFQVQTQASSWGATGTSESHSQRSRGIDPCLKLREEKTGLSLSCGMKLGIPVTWDWSLRKFGSFRKCVQYPFMFQVGTWDSSRDTALEMGLMR